MRPRVTIIGGGLAGASLACALGTLDLDITVLEATPLEQDAQPSFDERTIALTFSSRHVLEGIGIWPEIAMEAGPIHRIHISNRGHAGFARLDRDLIGTDALGYVVPTRILGQALTKRLRHSTRIDYRCPAQANRIDPDPKGADIHVDVSGERIASSLVVLAEGGRSPLAKLTGLTVQEKQYSQEALVGIVGVDRDQDATAYERFTRHGPLALLPLDPRRFALAWTLPQQEAREMLTLPQDVFLEALQEAFGDRAGFFNRCDRLQVYPLRRAELENPVAERLVALGNAAHVVHPVAGQGFNLGLRDVAHLAEELSRGLGEGKDIGSPEILDRYDQSRQRQTKRVQRFTDGLLQIFANEYAGLSMGRNIALNLLEVFPPAKRVLLKRTAGLSGALPRLARGLPLGTGL